MASDLETILLRAFVTSARAGSISRAAKVLGQSQPALSQQLRKLERSVGQPLLHRAATGVVLTTAGERLMPYAERILSLSAQALTATGQALSGHCGVGLIEDLMVGRLSEVLADFARLNPGARLELISLPGPAMREALADGRVQLALCDTSSFAEAPRWTVRLPLVWAAGPDFDPESDPLPLVLFSQPCGWRGPVLDALEKAGREWRVTFESTALSGVRAAVRAGLGVAPLPQAQLEPGRTAPAPDGLPALPDVELGLVRRPGTEGDSLVDAVECLLRNVV